jgi:serine/threonine protein kinase
MVSRNVSADEHLIDEADIMKRMDHPNILDLRFAGWDGGRFVIIAPLMKGDLHKKAASMAQAGTLNSWVVFGWVRDVASGLLYMHHVCGIVHGDIKPSNILWAGDGQYVKISDFGLSKLAPCTEHVGTPGYKAPEIVGLDGRRSYSTPVDIFAWAMMIIYILTGTNPFNNYEDEQINEKMRKALRTVELSPPWNPTTHIPPEYWEITDTMWKPLLLQCLTVNPAGRPSAGQLYEQCCEALAPPTIDVHPHMAEELRRLGIEQEADLQEVDEDFLRDPECKLDLETKRRLMRMKAEWDARKTALLKPIVHSPAAGGAAAGGV